MLGCAERRKGLLPVPPNQSCHLTELQRAALSRLEGFGWRIEFIRRQNLDHPVVVIASPGGENHGVLTEDGQVDRSSDIKLR
jgi:hypothetical protein